MANSSIFKGFSFSPVAQLPANVVADVKFDSISTALSNAGKMFLVIVVRNASDAKCTTRTFIDPKNMTNMDIVSNTVIGPLMNQLGITEDASGDEVFDMINAKKGTPIQVKRVLQLVEDPDGATHSYDNYVWDPSQF